jgi:hypothetical protein
MLIEGKFRVGKDEDFNKDTTGLSQFPRNQ